MEGAGLVRELQAEQDRNEINRVSQHLGQGGVAIVAEGLQRLTEGRVLVQDSVHIPDVPMSRGNPAGLVELMDAVRDQTSHEEDQQKAVTSKTTQVEADDGGRGSTGQTRIAVPRTERGAEQGLQCVRGKDRGGQEECQLDALTQMARKATRKTARCLPRRRTLDFSFDVAPETGRERPSRRSSRSSRAAATSMVTPSKICSAAPSKERPKEVSRTPPKRLSATAEDGSQPDGGISPSRCIWHQAPSRMPMISAASMPSQGKEETGEHKTSLGKWLYLR